MSGGFIGHGYGWSSYMDPSHCWLGMKDFSDYRRVKVRAGADFGKLRAKKDFEIVCAWWNRSYTDSYVQDNGTIRAHVGVKEWDWSYDEFYIRPEDSDETIARKLAWGFQSVWGYYVAGPNRNEFSKEMLKKIRDCLEEREPFFWVSSGENWRADWNNVVEIPFTETVDSFFRRCAEIKSGFWNAERKARILDDIAEYFWSPEATGFKVDRKRLAEVVGQVPIGWLVSTHREPYESSRVIDPGVSFSSYSRNYKGYGKLVERLADEGMHPIPEADLKAAEDVLLAKRCAANAKAAAKKAAKEKTSRDAYKGKWWLVKWSGNWADEIDLRSSSVMKDSELKRFKKDMKAAGDLTVNVGTNQSIETTGAEYLGGCEFVEIKDASTREFLLEHCDRSDDWSPSSVWENA